MSRLGKKPLPIPDKVKVDLKDRALEFSGPAGKLVMKLHARAKVKVENNQLFVTMEGDTREDSMMQGLTRGMIKTALEGVVNGYKKNIEIQGLGYKAAVEGKNLVLQLGFSHPVHFNIPEDIKVVVDKQTFLSITGVDKTLVGEVAASIRQLRPPEPYQGTGVRYAGEHIIRKAGKAAASGAAGAVKK